MRWLFVLVLVFGLIGLVCAEERLVGLNEEDFDEGVEVVVKMRDSGVRAFDGDFNGRISYEVVRINSKELDVLLEDEDVVGVYSRNYVRAFMGEAVGIVNSDVSNNLRINSLNLTGTGQTVCVIDSGVNFSHPDLVGKNTSCVVDCYDKACVENCSVGDDHGHGTHVAGIVGASGGLTGVAPNVSLIGVKILGADGGGSGNDNDLANAVDWCVAANSSVITMSLGTVTLFDSACDAVGGLEGWRDSIDAAVSSGVVVVIATGNDGNLTSISAPACLSSAIPVGDSYDADVGAVNWVGECNDATTFADKIVCHANRNSLVRLFAPGAMINSTASDGGYEERGGTSMATPMVSGVIAILKQYLDASGQSKTPVEIEDILNGTGVVLDDSNNSGLNFSRVDAYAALLSVDVTEPSVTLISPVDSHVNTSVNQSFVCNVSDWQLANVTFRIWNSSGAVYNESSSNLSGVSNSSNFSLSDMALGEYKWNCFVSDAKGNVGPGSSNFSLTIGSIEVSLNSPANGSYTNVNYSEFNCSSFSDAAYELVNVSFRLWNSSGVLIFNESRNISGFDNVTVFNWTFSDDGSYDWACVALNNNSDEGNGVNYSLVYDSVAPVVGGVTVVTSTGSAVVSWSTNESANSSLVVSGGVWGNSSDYVLDHSISVSSLSASTLYSYVLESCDRAANCVNGSGSFTTDAVSDGGGGGGSSGSSSISTSSVSSEVVLDEDVVYNVGSSELAGGYTRGLKSGEKMNFSLFDAEGGRHLLTVNEVGEDYVDLTIESDPISLRLGLGESVKLNLTSGYYYDLFVRLEGIVNGSAELTIRLIYEEIVFDDGVVEESDYFWVVGVLIVVLGVVVLVVVLGNKGRKHEKRLVRKELRLLKKGNRRLAKREKKLKRKKGKKKNG